MGGLKTLFGAALLAFFAGPASAGQIGALTLRFAECTGRLSALMEYSWLVNIPSDRVTAQRAAMIALLDASTDPGQRRAAMAHRIEAKAAHWSLLTRATFNADPDDAAWAGARAEQAVASCVEMALS